MLGYYQKPTLSNDSIVFVCEDDLWWVGVEGGVAQRLTAHPGRASDPIFAPDGKTLAFIGRDEGQGEVYLLRYDEGSCERLTFLGADTRAVAFSPNGEQIFYSSNYGQPFGRSYALGTVAVKGGPARAYPWGPAASIAFEKGGRGRVLGRHTWDPARWKRYRGGTVGQLWIDREGQGEFQRLLDTGGNLTRPLWVGRRIYFGSDHEGWCNLYSCNVEGQDLLRHTEHRDFYLRHPKSDGSRIVYQCGAHIYLFEPARGRSRGKSRRIDIQLRGSRGERLRRFPASAHHLEWYQLHPRGHSLAVTARGKALYFAHWEQSVTQLKSATHQEEPRYRLLQWLHDGLRLVCICDGSGEERVEVHSPGDTFKALPWEFGRALELVASPRADQVVVSNHRYQLWLGNLEDASLRLLDQCPYGRIRGLCWSPDGAWVAYCYPLSRSTTEIRLAEAATGQITSVTRGEFYDFAPAFDPEGRYLFFLSSRTFDPVWDQLSFELSFPKATRPYLALLRQDVSNPFLPEPKAPGEDKSKKRGKDKKKDDEEGEEDKEDADGIKIDREGLAQRILEFPVPEGRYAQIEALADQVFWTLFPVEGTLGEGKDSSGPPSNGSLQTFEWKTQEKKELYTKVTSFRLSADGNALAYRSGYKLRVVAPAKKPESTEDHYGRKTGWINLTRLRVPVTPLAEWKQMAREAWRLMRDHFWDEGMSGVDWESVFRRYAPLLDRLGSRSELSDWLWEVQAELGTSHAYEYGGDYKSEPSYPLGKLAADIEWDKEHGAYRVQRMVEGDCWNADVTSPLLRPGAGVKPGDLLLAINGHTLRRERPYQEQLVHCASQEVQLSLRSPDAEEVRQVHVKALRVETPARYREWVTQNRRWVHQRSGGRVGYLHVPNMGPWGFAEFHRGYFAELHRDALIIDVRYNGGGNVSQLLLERLARRVIGWEVPRLGRPESYPMEAPLGPLVAVTNEEAGSDGDIFSHAFKLLKLGPLVGTRTWGGVHGIWPRHKLVDGTTTTQPEFATWFSDAGWKLENYGTDPDYLVEILPQDWKAGRDPQLEKAAELALQALEDQPPRPDFSDRPNLAPPR